MEWLMCDSCEKYRRNAMKTALPFQQNVNGTVYLKLLRTVRKSHFHSKFHLVMVLVSEGKNSGHRGLESEQLNIMASTEKFCLRWNDFESNISSAFRDLKEDKDFSDVTLACSDQQVEAHKVILAASSNFF